MKFILTREKNKKNIKQGDRFRHFYLFNFFLNKDDLLNEFRRGINRQNQIMTSTTKKLEITVEKTINQVKELGQKDAKGKFEFSRVCPNTNFGLSGRCEKFSKSIDSIGQIFI